LSILRGVLCVVCVHEQGCRIESVPLRRLVELSGFRKRRWDFVGGWLILEGFWRATLSFHPASVLLRAIDYLLNYA
jgi:hypothetical protein